MVLEKFVYAFDLRSDGVLGYDCILNFTWLEFSMENMGYHHHKY